MSTLPVGGNQSIRQQKTHDLRQRVDWIYSHESAAKIEPTNSEVQGAGCEDCATAKPRIANWHTPQIWMLGIGLTAFMISWFAVLYIYKPFYPGRNTNKTCPGRIPRIGSRRFFLSMTTSSVSLVAWVWTFFSAYFTTVFVDGLLGNLSD
jgi:hypothetical protein